MRAIFGSQTIGAVANSPIVVALLAHAQRITGKEGRVTEILVKPKRGAAHLVERELHTLAAVA